MTECSLTPALSFGRRAWLDVDGEGEGAEPGLWWGGGCGEVRGGAVSIVISSSSWLRHAVFLVTRSVSEGRLRGLDGADPSLTLRVSIVQRTACWRLRRHGARTKPRSRVKRNRHARGTPRSSVHLNSVRQPARHKKRRPSWTIFHEGLLCRYDLVNKVGFYRLELRQLVFVERHAQVGDALR